jgi:hypothetical protein
VTRGEQLREAKRLTVAQFQAMERAIASQDLELAGLAKQALLEIRKAKYNPVKANQIIDRLFVAREDILGQSIASQLKDSAELSTRVMQIYDKYKSEAPIVTKAEIATARQVGIRMIPPPIDVPPMSEFLHSESIELREATKKSVARSLREYRNADLAGKDLVQTARRMGSELGDQATVPKKLDTYMNSLKRLRGSDTLPVREQLELAAESRKARKDLEKYLTRIKDGRAGYREALQIIENQGTAGVEKALERWISEKQRYHAERITRTEMAAQHRMRQINQWKREGRVIGVIWTLNGGSRKSYVGRTPVPKTGKSAGRRCACEANAGQLFTLEYAESHPRLGHPHCRCFWVPCYSQPVGAAAPANEARVPVAGDAATRPGAAKPPVVPPVAATGYTVPAPTPVVIAPQPVVQPDFVTKPIRGADLGKFNDALTNVGVKVPGQAPLMPWADQAVARQESRSLMAEHYGMVSHDVGPVSNNWLVLPDKDPLLAGKCVAHHQFSGAIAIKQSIAKKLRTSINDLVGGKVKGDYYDVQHKYNALRVWTHEEIHGMSSLAKGVDYPPWMLAFEESTTEIVARKVSRETLGYVGRRTGEVPFSLPNYRPKDVLSDRTYGYGSYQEWVDKLIQTVGDAVGNDWGTIPSRVEAAALKIRQVKTLDPDCDTILARFVSALEVTPEQGVTITQAIKAGL